MSAVSEAAGVVLYDAALPEVRRIARRQCRHAIESRHRLLDAASAEIIGRAIENVSRRLLGPSN
jgi:hypothetical protein